MERDATTSPSRWWDRDPPVVAALCAWMLVVFAAVWNPWWMPSGDAEVFVVTARNLYHGRGLTFNGLPVAFIPPGWPIVLAGLFHLTDQYLWLKAVQIGNMMVFLLASYGILRRFGSPRLAGLSCGLAAVLWPLYPLTMWLHSDAFFCAIAGVTGLACVWWGDGKLGRWWLIAILAGCALAVFVRWAALVQALVLAALICGSGRAMAGRLRPWPHLAARQWLGAAAIFAVSLGTFAGLKYTLGADPPGTQSAAKLDRAGEVAPPRGHWPPMAMISLPEEVVPPSLLIGREDPERTAAEELAHRALAIPQWVSWTFFAPLRVVDAVRLGGVAVGLWLDRAVGLLALAMVGVAAWRGMRRAEGPHYLWLGLLVYIVALGLNWPHINNRYLVPIAPLLIAGVLTGLGELGAYRLLRGLRWSFIVAVLAINGGLWLVDVTVCRAGSAREFYGRWEAGIYPSLIEIGVYLDRQPENADGRIVASERYQNLNERWEYPLSPRSIVLMTDRTVGVVPTPMTGWGVRKAQAWARESGVRYYVQQNPTLPGRIWHFRVSPAVEEFITGKPQEPQRPQFALFEMQPDPSRKFPDLKSLKHRAVPALSDAELERMTRRIPHVRREPEGSRGPLP